MQRKFPPPIIFRLQTKLIILIMLGVMAVSLSSSYFMSDFIVEELGRETVSAARRMLNFVDISVMQNMLNDRPHQTQPLLESLSDLPNVKTIMILDDDGVIRFASDPKLLRRKLSSSNPSCTICHRRPVSARPTVVEVPTPDRQNNSYLRTIAVIENRPPCWKCHGNQGAHLGVLVVDIFNVTKWRLIGRLRENVVEFLIIGFVVLLVVMAVATDRLVASPISRIIDAIRDVGAGDFSKPFEIRGHDEIAVLQEAFDHMRTDLAQFVMDLEARDSHIEELYSLRQNLQSINRSLNRRILELTLINKIGAVVNSVLEPRELFQVVTETIHENLEVDGFSMLIWNEETDSLEVKAYSGNYPEAAAGAVIRRGEGIAGRTVQTGRPRLIADVREEPEYVQFGGLHPDARSLLVVPLLVHDKVIGVLHVTRSEVGAFTPYDLAFFSAMANQLAIAVDNARLYEYQRERATTDALTSLCNHGCFQSQLDEEISRVRRYDHSMSLLMLDIDKFKSFNDQFGHQAGDEVLRAVAAVLRSHTRDVDTVARYGGEEFAVILPETPLENARIVAERIRASVEDARVSIPDQPEPLRVTISIGATLYKYTDSKNEFIDRADQALYQAKDQGRNRIVVAE